MRELVLIGVLATVGCTRLNPNRPELTAPERTLDGGVSAVDLAGIEHSHVEVSDLAAVDLAEPDLVDLAKPDLVDLAKPDLTTVDLSKPDLVTIDLLQPDLVSSYAPSASCPATINTAPLSTASLAGGGVDPDGGIITFQWTVTGRPDGSSSQPASPGSATTSFFVDLAGSYTLKLTVTDDEGQTGSCTVTINATAAQALHVELVWSTAFGDADLHLTQAGVTPSSAWFMPAATGEAACWYNNQQAAWLPDGPDGDATYDIDDHDGYGPENINIATNPAPGTYEIGVSYYCSHSVARFPGDPVAPGDGPTTATVKVYCGGTLAATYSGISLDKTGRFVDVASVTMPGCVGQSVMSPSWVSLIQPSTFAYPVHCPVPCTSVSDCTPGEVCGASASCLLD